MLWDALGGAGVAKAAAAGETMLISVTRFNNVAIMLTQFGRFGSHEAICKAIYTGQGLDVELLTLLVQVRRQMKCSLFGGCMIRHQYPAMSAPAMAGLLLCM